MYAHVIQFYTIQCIASHLFIRTLRLGSHGAFSQRRKAWPKISRPLILVYQHTSLIYKKCSNFIEKKYKVKILCNIYNKTWILHFSNINAEAHYILKQIVHFLSINFFFFIHSDCRVFLQITSLILVNNICSFLLKSCQRKDNCYQSRVLLKGKMVMTKVLQYIFFFISRINMSLIHHEVKLKFNNFALYSNKFLDETCLTFTYIK